MLFVDDCPVYPQIHFTMRVQCDRVINGGTETTVLCTEVWETSPVVKGSAEMDTSVIGGRARASPHVLIYSRNLITEYRYLDLIEGPIQRERSDSVLSQKFKISSWFTTKRPVDDGYTYFLWSHQHGSRAADSSFWNRLDLTYFEKDYTVYGL